MTVEEIAKEYSTDLITARKALNIFEHYSSWSDSFDTPKRADEFFRRTINRLHNSEADEISYKTRKHCFPRYGD